MMRAVQWVYDDTTDELRAVVMSINEQGSDVVWSTQDTTPPGPSLPGPTPE